MKTQNIALSLALACAVSLVACTNAREMQESLCQKAYDCEVQNCTLDDADSDCDAVLKVQLNDCKEMAEIEENARQHLPGGCKDALEEQIACRDDSFKCHATQVKTPKKTVTRYNAIVASTECNILDNYIEDECKPEPKNTIYIEKNGNNN